MQELIFPTKGPVINGHENMEKCWTELSIQNDIDVNLRKPETIPPEVRHDKNCFFWLLEFEPQIIEINRFLFTRPGLICTV